MPNPEPMRVPAPLEIVLVHPEIPPNTGNVARTCAVTGCHLHLVEPLGFRLDDADLRRAGLDYWEELQVQTWTSLEAYLAGTAGVRRWWCSTRGTRRLPEVPFALGDHLCFGSETRGLPDSILATAGERLIRIPMRPTLRSLNLSNATAVVVYRALESLGFPGME